jgi:MerR-like DNA binding protein
MENPTIEERQRDRLGDELIWHAEGIARETNSKVSQVRYWVRTGKIPVSRLAGGREYFTTRKALRKIFNVI